MNRKTFEIDDLSKEKIMLAYELYYIKTMGRILSVSHSYHKDGFNVYVFGNNLHIGVKIEENKIIQKYIEPDASKSITGLTKMYNKLVLEHLEDARPNIGELPMAMKQINQAISEYINRDYVYDRYKKTKYAMLNEMRLNVINRIEKEQNLIKKIQSRTLFFKSDRDNESFSSGFPLSVNTLSYKRGSYEYLVWYVERNTQNLNRILVQARNIVGSSDRVSGENLRFLQDMATHLFKYATIIAYHTSEIRFISLFNESITIRPNTIDTPSSKLVSLFSNDFVDVGTLCKFFRESYRLYSMPDFFQNAENMASSSTNLRISLSNFDYGVINNLGYLRDIVAMYEFIVDKHKKYVPSNIKDMEKNIFGLNFPLGGSKDTKNVLDQIINIKSLRKRIEELEGATFHEELLPPNFNS
jgi:hypothetical protein